MELTIVISNVVINDSFVKPMRAGRAAISLRLDGALS